MGNGAMGPAVLVPWMVQHTVGTWCRYLANVPCGNSALKPWQRQPGSFVSPRAASSRHGRGVLPTTLLILYIVTEVAMVLVTDMVIMDGWL